MNLFIFFSSFYSTGIATFRRKKSSHRELRIDNIIETIANSISIIRRQTKSQLSNDRSRVQRRSSLSTTFDLHSPSERKSLWDPHLNPFSGMSSFVFFFKGSSSSSLARAAPSARGYSLCSLYSFYFFLVRRSALDVGDDFPVFIYI